MNEKPIMNIIMILLKEGEKCFGRMLSVELIYSLEQNFQNNRPKKNFKDWYEIIM